MKATRSLPLPSLPSPTEAIRRLPPPVPSSPAPQPSSPSRSAASPHATVAPISPSPPPAWVPRSSPPRPSHLTSAQNDTVPVRQNVPAGQQILRGHLYNEKGSQCLSVGASPAAVGLFGAAAVFFTRGRLLSVDDTSLLSRAYTASSVMSTISFPSSLRSRYLRR